MASSSLATRPSSVPPRWDGAGPAHAGPLVSLWGVLAAISPSHRARHLDPRGDLELAEQVAHVRFDGLDAEEQLGGDLGVCVAADDEARHFQLALRERFETAAVCDPGPRAPMDVMTLFSQLALRLVAIARRAGGVEVGDRALELARGAGVVAGLSGLGERAAGECP